MNGKMEDTAWRKLQERNDFTKPQKERRQGVGIPIVHPGKMVGGRPLVGSKELKQV